MSSGDSSSSSSPPTAMSPSPSSPPAAMLPATPSPATREKKVYIRVEKISENSNGKRILAYDWYAIPIDNNSEGVRSTPYGKGKGKGKEKVETLRPVFESPSDSPQNLCGFAAWESLLYVFGGYDVHTDKPVSNVYCIDTRRPQLGWEPCPSMEYARDSQCGVVYDRKICAFGGFPDLPIYGESLQSVSGNRWSPMYMTRKDQYPPFNINGHAIFSDKLFVYGTPTNTGSLHCYDFKTEEWSVTEKCFGDWQYPCASIDEIMYLVEGGKFRGYDLITHQWYSVVGLEEDGNRNRMLPPFTDEASGWGIPSSLVYIGNGTLCLLWNHFESLDYSAIHCTKFTVSKEDIAGCSFIRANVKSFKIFRLLHGGCFAGSVAIDTGEDSDGDKVEDEKSVIITKKGSAIDEGELPKKKEEEE